MSMAFHPIRMACPVCGKPMKLVVGDDKGRARYICTNCDDPLWDPAARRWADGP